MCVLGGGGGEDYRHAVTLTFELINPHAGYIVEPLTGLLALCAAHRDIPHPRYTSENCVISFCVINTSV